MTQFSNLVFNVTAQSPNLLSYSLSGSNNKVVMDSLNTTLCGKTVVGILYNEISNPNANLVTLSAGNFQFRVSRSYHGSTMGIYFNDRSTTTFTCNTATAAQVLGAISYENRGPEELRKRLLGYF